MAAEQDPWAASLPCYASDESGPDAAQEPPRKKQRKLWHSSDAATRSGNLQCDNLATPDLTSAQFSPDAFFSQPCAPEADPAVRAYGGTRGESVGHWIDAALADEGWWGSGNGTQRSIREGCLDGPFDPLLEGAYAEER